MARSKKYRSPAIGFDQLEDRVVPSIISSIRNKIESEVSKRAAEEQAKQAQQAALVQQTQAAQTVATPTDRAANPVLLFVDDANAVKSQQQVFSTLETGGLEFLGGMWTARGDVTGDGVADPMVATGAGAIPVVKVFDGATSTVFREFAAYELSYKGGVFVTSADINADGKSEVVVGTDQSGGPRVRVFSGESEKVVLADFYAIADPDFRGGVRVAMGDINGDGIDDLVVSAGFGGGPRIAGYDGAQLAQGKYVNLFNDFFAFEDTLRNGAYLTLGYVDGDKYADIIFGGGPGGGPRVRVASGAAVMAQGGAEALNHPLADFFAGSTEDRGGVRVGTVLGEDKLARILTVGATGDAYVYDAAGKQGQQIRRETVLNSGLLDDDVTRHKSSANPAPNQLDGLYNAIKGSYSGLFTTPTTYPATGLSTTKTLESQVRFSIQIDDVKSAMSFRSLQSAGGPLSVSGRVRVEVGGKAPLDLPFTGSFTVEPFAGSDLPLNGALAGLNASGGASATSVNVGYTYWKPEGLAGGSFSASTAEYSFASLASLVVLQKGANPPAPAVAVDYNANAISGVIGTYAGTYTAPVQVQFPQQSLSDKSVTVILDVTNATANEPNANPQDGGKFYNISGTLTVKVPGQPDQVSNFTGVFRPDAFTGDSPVAGTVSFQVFGAATAGTFPELTWSPTGLTGTGFTTSTFSYSVGNPTTPFTWAKS